MPTREAGAARGLSPELYLEYVGAPERLRGSLWLLLGEGPTVLIQVVHVTGGRVLWVTEAEFPTEARWMDLSVLLSEYGSFYYLGRGEDLAWIRPGAVIRYGGMSGGPFYRIVRLVGSRVVVIRVGREGFHDEEGSFSFVTVMESYVGSTEAEVERGSGLLEEFLGGQESEVSTSGEEFPLRLRWERLDG